MGYMSDIFICLYIVGKPFTEYHLCCPSTSYKNDPTAFSLTPKTVRKTMEMILEKDNYSLLICSVKFLPFLLIFQ